MKIAVIGIGMIGSSLAALFTGHGYYTVMLASCDNRVGAAKKNWSEVYQVLVEKEYVTKEQVAICEQYLHITTKYEDLADADIIFECVCEDLQVKYKIYEKIENICSKFQAIVSTTSAMSPETLAKGLKKHPEKIVVAHPFNPPHLVPFVELVRSPESSDETVACVYDFLEKCGRKVCIMKKCAPGFIANRLQHALVREAVYMVEQGLADPKDIDKALMYSFMPRYTSVGLFEHQDAAGLDMVEHIQDYLLSDLCNASGVQTYIEDCVEKGNLGQKTGQGIYQWDEEAKKSFKQRAAEPYWKYFNWKLPEKEK